AMTAETRRIRAVLLHPLPHGLRLAAAVLRQVWHVWRWGCWRRSEETLQYPRATGDGRRAIGVGGQHEDRAFTQQSVTRCVFHRHFAEVCPLHSLDTVMLRQALVQEGVVRRQQFDDVAIAAQDAVDEETELFLHECALIECSACLRKLPAIRRDFVK